MNRKLLISDYMKPDLSSVSFIHFIMSIDFIMLTHSCTLEPLKHYANTPMQYTAIFHSDKNVNFQKKNCIFYAPNFEKVGSILLSACPCVRVSVL